MAATLSKPNTKTTRRITLAEIAFTSASESKVDTAAGVIRGVKVLGLESKNTGRTLGLDHREFGDAVDKPYAYTLEALRAAVPFYENIGVYVDHPEFSYDATGKRSISRRDRKTAERFGKLVNVRVTETGMFADLEYLKSHPLAPMVAEAAERMPEQLGLSHNAGGRPELRNGRIVITEIADVRSVDLVGERPGTTTSLFESANPTKGTTVKITLKQLFEAADPKAASKPLLAKLLELDAAMGDMPMDYAGEVAPTTEAPAAEDQLKSGLLAAVTAKLEKASGEEWTAVLAALGLSDSVADIVSGKKGGDKGGDAGGDKSKDAATAETAAEIKAASDRANASLLECVDLLSAAGQPVLKPVLKAMQVLETADRQAFVDSLPKPVNGSITPRSQSPKVPVTETAADKNKGKGLDISTPAKGISLLRGLN